jgi:hypothetical protein
MRSFEDERDPGRQGGLRAERFDVDPRRIQTVARECRSRSAMNETGPQR